MKWVISRYNHDISYLPTYTSDYVLYDRSEEPIEGSIVVQNIGSDIYDKFTFIIDNYDNLPDVAIYTKANIFKFITPEEFEEIKDNTTFTPILTKNHKEITASWDDTIPFSYYRDGIYWELNNGWYLNTVPPKSWSKAREVARLLGIISMDYVPFAPGSGYILPKGNILKHSKEFYQELRSFLGWGRYPGEAMVIERGLYTLWK